MNLENYLNSSPFSQMDMPTTARLKHFGDTLLHFLDYEKSSSLKGRLPNQDFNIQDYIPKFQRGNDKWSLDMKQKFILNILKGMRSSIILCRIGGEYSDAIILDGQQRLTAIKGFMTNQYPVIIKDKEYYYKDIENLYHTKTASIAFYIINAKDLKEACRFYIDMNENITHSKEDIEIAYKFLEEN